MLLSRRWDLRGVFQEALWEIYWSCRLCMIVKVHWRLLILVREGSLVFCIVVSVSVGHFCGGVSWMMGAYTLFSFFCVSNFIVNSICMKRIVHIYIVWISCDVDGSMI